MRQEWRGWLGRFKEFRQKENRLHHEWRGVVLDHRRGGREGGGEKFGVDAQTLMPSEGLSDQKG